MVRYKGILCTVLSAVIFGLTAVLARDAYNGGGNGITLSFLRAALALPVLFGILRVKKIPLRLTREDRKGVLVAGVLGTSCTTLTLYISYSYISVGMSTTLHFIYPILTTLGCVLFFREKLSPLKLGALVCATAGILLSVERGSSGAALGVALALVSGVCYAFYIIYVDRSGLKEMYYFKLSFYLCVMLALCSGTFGLVTGSLTLRMTPRAWACAVLVALLVSICALSLFQLGIRYVGASAAAILSTFEPITSIVLGALWLGETVSPAKLAGCALILVSVVLISFASRGRTTAPDPEIKV